MGAGSFALSGIASASPGEKDTKKKNSTDEEEENSEDPVPEDSELPVPEDQIVHADEMESFNPNAKHIPVDELPFSNEAIGEISTDGKVSTMASGNCYGTGVRFLDVEVCLYDDGSLKASVGALGVVADSIVIEPGEASRDGYVTTAIPGLPGTVQEFTSGWTIQWSGFTVEKVSVEASLRAWELGVGWYDVATLDVVLID